MSKLITHDNYEEFYLDYLEGNLSGDMLLAFEAFLDAHPDLRIDESPLPLIEAEEATFDPIRKLALKQGIDLNDLTAETLDFFLIARQEGQLNADQEAQLNHWLEANAHYRQDARLYALTTLQPDYNEVFTAKEDLKKPVGGRVIPLWTAGLAVAAGLALFFTFNIGNNPVSPVNHSGGNSIAVEHSDSLKDNNNTADSARLGNQASNQNTEKTEKRKNREKTFYPTQIRHDNEQKKEITPRRRIIQQRNILQEGTILASLEKRNAQLSQEDKTITPLYPYIEPSLTPKHVDVNNDMAAISVNDMKNPIEPVTSRLSETLNRPIDFRTAKASKQKGGGFYLKIGKLEISHQTASL